MTHLAALVTLLLLSEIVLSAQHSASLTWEDNLNPDGTTYNVYKASGTCLTGNTPTLIASDLTTLAYTDTTVTAGGSYCYYVTASGSGEESGPSSMVDAQIPPDPLTLLSITGAVSIQGKVH